MPLIYRITDYAELIELICRKFKFVHEFFNKISHAPFQYSSLIRVFCRPLHAYIIVFIRQNISKHNFSISWW